jgi:hypothetical protein
MSLCCASCCACRLDSKGSNLGFHTCKTHANLHTGTHVAHHARLVPTLGAARVGTCWHNTRATSNVGTDVAPHAKPMPTLDLARMLQHKQNTCQLLTCKSRANSYPQVIHRLPHAKPVPLPMLAQMLLRKKRANCWTNVGQMLGRGGA